MTDTTDKELIEKARVIAKIPNCIVGNPMTLEFADRLEERNKELEISAKAHEGLTEDEIKEAVRAFKYLRDIQS